MNAEQLLVACSRPLLFEYDNPHARYGIGGSSVLGSYGGIWFLLTADHCLDYAATHATQLTTAHTKMLMVPLIDGSRTFFSYTAWFNTRRQTKDVPDKTDMAIFRISPLPQADRENSQLNVIPFDLCSKSPLTIPVGTKLMLRGYPLSLKNEATYSEAEFDSGAIRRQGLLTSGTYIGPDAYTETCHLFRFDCLDQIPDRDVNGMSGSPVFSVIEQPNKTQVADFAGLFIGRKQFLPDQGIFIDRSVFMARLPAVLNAPLPGGPPQVRVVVIRTTC